MAAQSEDRRLDPDVWTSINLVVNCVTMFGQLATLALQVKDRPELDHEPVPPSQIPHHIETNLEHVRDEIQAAIRYTEKLIRILSRAEAISGRSPMRLNFRFGQEGVLLNFQELQSYKDTIQKLALTSSNIGVWVLSIIQQSPEVSKYLGERLLLDRGDMIDSINRLYIIGPENELVLTECLDLLALFNQLLGKLDRFEN